MRIDTDTNPYTDNGYINRADYLEALCDEYPADVVHTLADLLGETEDFDGLVTMLEDFSETEAESDDDAAAAATGFREALAARDAAAVRTARENLTGAYLEADAALNAARALHHAAFKAYTDAIAATHAATYAADAARDALNAAD